MRNLVWSVCLLWATVADAGPLQPRRPTAKFSAQALASFVNGLMADRAGNLHHAFNAYTASLSRERHATTYYNLAELSLRLERTEDATKYFKGYLELAPDASDRAAIERLVKELETAPPVITIGGRVHGSTGEADALVLLDGVVIGRSPLTIRPSLGMHEVERITATTYARATFTAKPGMRAYVAVDLNSIDAELGGNVVISGLGHPRAWREGPTQFASSQRFTLAPGRHAAKLEGFDACSPVELDVKSEDELTYVRVVLEDRAAGSGCRKVKRVRSQRLKVAAP